MCVFHSEYEIFKQLNLYEDEPMIEYIYQYAQYAEMTKQTLFLAQMENANYIIDLVHINILLHAMES